jgi:hypothetical protein
MQISDKYGIIFLVTKFGYLYVLDVETVCSRMLTYADVCSRMPTYADVC